MIIKENPFYILGASLRDNRQKIMSLAEEKSLEVDEAVCSEARMVLTNPRRRLVAELSWFPGVSLKETSVILSKLKFGVLETELQNNERALKTGRNRLLQQRYKKGRGSNSC